MFDNGAAQSNQSKLFDYFILLGLKDEMLTGKSTLIEVEQSIPGISAILRQIFPQKASYISLITQESIEEDIDSPFFQDYIIYSNAKPKENFHIFSTKYENEQGICYTWHFAVLTIWEEISVNTMRVESGKYYYAAKALVLASQNAFYLLYKKILEEINFKLSESTEQPIELFIMYLHSLERGNKDTLVKLFDFDYFIQSESVLPFLDLNLFTFFSFFSLDDFLIICEHFLRRWPIVLFSENISLIYPTFFCFITLIYPLHITNLNDYFILLSSDLITRVLHLNFATFIGVNSAMPNDEVLTTIANSKDTNTLFIDLDKGKSNKTRMKYFDISTQTFESIQKDKIGNKENAIDYIFSGYIKDDINLLALVENNIDEIKSEGKDGNDYFYYISPGSCSYSNVCNLRKHCFSLFSKLLMFNLPYTFTKITNINYVENKNLPKNGIEINFIDKFDDKILKDFYSHFTTTPSFNIVYKHKCKATDPNLTNLILLDELIKILSKDEKRLYFDHCLSIKETLDEDVNTILIKQEDYFIIDNLTALHVYNLIKLRTKTSDFVFDEIGADNYLIRYTKVNFHFEKFKKFLNSNLDNNLKLDNQNNFLIYNNKNQNIILNEIKAFIYLINTGTLHIENLEEVVCVIVLTMLSVQVLSEKEEGSEKRSENNFKKFKFIYSSFMKRKGFGNKFSFLTSMVYQMILDYDESREELEFDFLNRLKKYSIIPTFFIYISANDEEKESKLKKNEKISNENNFDFIFESLLGEGFKLKESQNKIKNRKSQIELVEPLSQTLTCINGCELVNHQSAQLFDKKYNINKNLNNDCNSITSSNMTSVKCSFCNEENVLVILTNYENIGIGFLDSILQHPIKLLLFTLNQILTNKSLIFNRKSLSNLTDALSREEVRLILFYMKYFHILEDETIKLFDTFI